MVPPATHGRTLWGLGKYALHGLAFAVLFFVVAVAWAVALVLLVVCGLYLGLILGFVLLFVIMGYLNATLTTMLWFPVRTGFVTNLEHGVLLFLALLPVNLAVLAVQLFVTSNPVVLFGIFLVTTPILGILAKAVAGVWQIHSYEEKPFGEMPAEPEEDEASSPGFQLPPR